MFDNEKKDFDNDEREKNETKSSDFSQEIPEHSDQNTVPQKPLDELNTENTPHTENNEAGFDSRNSGANNGSNNNLNNGYGGYFGNSNGGYNGYNNGYNCYNNGYGGYYQPWQKPPIPPKKKKQNGVLIALCAVLSVLFIVTGVLVGFVYKEYVVPIIDQLKESAPNDNGTEGGDVNSGSGIKDENFNIPQQETPGARYATLADAYEATHKSFVEINTVSESGGYVSASAGSGVIIAKMSNNSGYYILTNNHVVEDATKITVKAYCGDVYKEYTAITDVLTDEMTDLAVIAISETEELQVAKVGKSSSVRVGEDIYVIGNPLGTLAGTLTNGIISAQTVEILVGEHIMSLMQTNCAINPGNSGGPMFNMSGEVIGIVNAKYSDVSVEGIGFAIPIDLAIDIAEQMVTKGYVEGRHDLGISVEYGSYGAGLWITKIEENSALRSTDLVISSMNAYRIESINGVVFESTASANKYIDERLKAGDNVKITISVYQITYGQLRFKESKELSFTLGQKNA